MRAPIIAFLALTAGPAVAEDMTKTCEHAAKLANSIMQARQRGVPAADTMKIMLEKTPEESKRLMKEMVLGAYSRSRFSDAEYAQRSIQDYSDETYVSCMSAE